jgi:aspartate racemase
MAFPLFPDKSETDENMPVETFTINLEDLSFNNRFSQNTKPLNETALLSAIALFLAKLANTERVVLPVSATGASSSFVYPYRPLCFEFDKNQSFEAQTPSLHQAIENQRIRVGFFYDLFFRHPEFKQQNRGERFQDCNLAMVILSKNGSDFVPFKNAATHIIINVAAGTISLEMKIGKNDWPNVEYIGNHLQSFIEKLTKPETPISALNLLTTAEFEEFIFGYERKTVVDDSQLPITSLFDLQVKSNPEKAAIEYKAEKKTYRQLDQMAGNVAKTLLNSGFTAGSIAGIMIERSPQLIAGMLGILRAGGAYLPLDATFPQSRLDQIFSDSQLKFVLTSNANLPIVSGKVYYIIEIENAIDSAFTENEFPEVLINPEQASYIIYTSGSTGKPKGVEISHWALVSFTQSAIQRYNITPADRILQFATFTFDTAVEEIFTALSSGATLVLRTNEMASSVNEFLRSAQAMKITVLDLPTAFWQQLVTTMTSEGSKLLESVRLVIIGGEAVQMQAVKLWKGYFGAYPKLINTYGPTETTVVATSCYLDEANDQNSFPIGKPLGNTTTFVANNDLNPVLPGVPGQLIIGGPQLATRYVGDEALTNSRFIPDVFSKNPNGRLYLTGDLVSSNPDGTLVYMGRMDKQIKIRGFRVEPEEIDRLLSASGMVNESLTILCEQTEAKRLVSYIIPKATHPNLNLFLHDYLAKRLPDYMVPSAFVRLSAFPLNRNMKIDVAALPPPDFDFADDEPQQELTATQIQLRNIFNKVLNTGKSSLNANFFYLGGDSLLALALLSAIKTVFDQDISIAALYENPTLAQLAVLIDKQLVVSSKQKQILPEKVGNYITCLKKGGDVPPVFTIYLDAANGWLPGMLPDEQPVYTFIPQGSDGERIKYKTVGTIASFYIGSLLNLFPNTPVHLIGFSFGGLIALEMALQLQKRGVGFSTLTLIDTVAPQVWREMIRQTDFRQKFRYFTGNQKRKFFLLLGQKIPANLRNAYILHSWRKAAYHYSPKRNTNASRFFLVRSEKSLSDLPLLGWEDWPGFTFEVTIFEGDHHSIIRQRDKVAQLAEWMKSKMRL